MGARKETVVGHAKLDSSLPANSARALEPEAKQADSEAPRSGVRVVPPEVRVPRAPAVPTKVSAAVPAPVRFVPRRTLPTLPGLADAATVEAPTPPPPSARAPSSPSAPPPRPASVLPAPRTPPSIPPVAKKSVPPPLPPSAMEAGRRAALRPRVPRPGSSAPPPLPVSVAPAPAKPVTSLVATAVNWPLVRAPLPARPAVRPSDVPVSRAVASALQPALPPPPLRREVLPPVVEEARPVEMPAAVEVPAPSPIPAPVAIPQAIALPVAAPARVLELIPDTLPILEVPIAGMPSAEDVPTTPGGLSYTADVPPSVVDVLQPTLEGFDVVIDDHELRALRGNRKLGLFVGLTLAALAIATVLVLVFAR
jgi:hypothetical protein